MHIRTILAFAFGPLAGAGLGLLTVPVLAWAFNPEDLGRLNILQVTISFCLTVMLLGLDQAYVREFHESRDRLRLLKACCIPGFVLLTGCALLTAPFASKLSSILFGEKDPQFYWVALFCVVAAFIARFTSLILRMQERGMEFSLSQLISKVLLLVILGGILLLALPFNFLALQLATMTSGIVVAIFCLWRSYEQWMPAISIRINFKEIRSLLNYGTPLVFSGLANWCLVSTSAISLRTLSTFSDLGVYSVTSSLAGVATIFQSIFSVVWAPIVYKWVASGTDLDRVDNVARMALAIVCAIFALCGTFSWLTDFLLPANYTDVKYLILCAIVQPLLYTLSEITCIGINITRRTVLTIWITLFALFVNILLSVLLIPSLGVAGAVIANAVAYLAYFVVRTETSSRVWRRFPRTRLYGFASLATTLAVTSVALPSSLPFDISLFWLAFLFLVIWHFRADLFVIIDFTRKARKMSFLA